MEPQFRAGGRATGIWQLNWGMPETDGVVNRAPIAINYAAHLSLFSK
jgi:hypothetical protein